MDSEKEFRCEFCKKVQNPPRRTYETSDLLMQTPQSVWQEYRENGYTIGEAIESEKSYG